MLPVSGLASDMAVPICSHSGPVHCPLHLLSTAHFQLALIRQYRFLLK